MKVESRPHIGIYACVVVGILYLYVLVHIAYADISSQKYTRSIVQYEQDVRSAIRSSDFFDEFSRVQEFLSAQVRDKQPDPNLYHYTKMIFDQRAEYFMVRVYYTYPNSLGIATEHRQEFLFTREGKLITDLKEKK